jgi:glutathione synthase/RimK-type ligase-like ATP-grasp enzyme
MSGTVLIVSTIVDLATDSVVEALNYRGVPLVRVNTEDLPFASEISYSFGAEDSQSIFWKERPAETWFESVWYRRVRAPSVPDGMDSGTYDFCVRENRSALIGGLLGQQARWMSQPAAIWHAEFKPFQLQVAKDLGLKVPKTLISNRPESIREVQLYVKDLIAKPVRSGHVVKNGVECAVFTTRLKDEDFLDLADARLSSTIYQELLPKKYNVRVTIVGQKVFAAAIDSQSDPSASIDWRMTKNPNHPHLLIELTNCLVEKLLELMSRLSLSYGAIDLVLTPDGQYFFLEINPNGQWLWLDDMLNLGISEAIANWLAGEAP